MYRTLKRAILAAITVIGFAGSALAIDIQEVVSEGGISAWLVSDSTVPIVAVDVAFKGSGAVQDPEGEGGRASLMAGLLSEGAGDMDAVAFQTELQNNAIRLSFEASRDHVYADMRVLSSSVERGFGLMALALQEPRFAAEALERVRARKLASLRREQTDPSALAGRLWSKAAFPDHPYGTPTAGSVESVSALGVDAVRAAHAGAFGRDNLIIAVVGDIDAERLAPLLDKTFGALPETADLVAVPAVTPAVGITVTETLETPQSALRFGIPALNRDDPDFIPAFVMNHILGGGAFSSWLYKEVREKRGLAYGVYSYVAPFEHASVFGAGTSTRTDQATLARDIILQQFEKMATEGPSEAELNEAKSFLTGSYALRFGSSSSIARQLLFLQIEDLGKNYVTDRNGLIEAVTLEDVRRAAARIFDGVAPTIAIVGADG
ncbi:MAG: pitrilysin family protein [Pseudomonadota bacterium]